LLTTARDTVGGSYIMRKKDSCDLPSMASCI
jgi:hypothetical protein